MLGRKNYEQAEIDNGEAAVAAGLAAYKKLAAAVGDGVAAGALADFDQLLFNNLALALDRLYVHRLRSVTGKDTSPLNELELIFESLMNNGGVLRGNNVVRYVPADSVVGLAVGDQIRLTEDQFERLAAGVLAELRHKYLAA
jgi:hypothetical protein